MLKNIIPRQLVTCSPKTTVEELATLMRAEDVGAVLVTDSSNRPLGIVTDRDIVLRCVSHGKDCGDTKAEEIMTDRVEKVAETDSLFDVVQKIRSSEIRRVPIVDASGAAIGIVSLGDILKLLSNELYDLAEGIAPEQDKIREEAA